jgi:hypothetical protein
MPEPLTHTRDGPHMCTLEAVHAMGWPGGIVHCLRLKKSKKEAVAVDHVPTNTSVAVRVFALVFAMKRAFSLTELEAAIGPKEEPVSAQIFLAATMRRTKSLGSLHIKIPAVTKSDLEDSESQNEENLEAARSLLPSLSSLGLSFPVEVNGSFRTHEYEELKRSRGLCGKLPHSSIQQCSFLEVRENDSHKEQDEEARGAASALMDLFKQHSPNKWMHEDAASRVFLPLVERQTKSSPNEHQAVIISSTGHSKHVYWTNVVVRYSTQNLYSAGERVPQNDLSLKQNSQHKSTVKLS